MAELQDYSGAFNPALKFEDFSKEFLLKLMKVWQSAWLVMEGSWYDVVRERCGQEVADSCNLATWVRVAERVNPRYAKIANIELNTVVDSLKASQLPLDNPVGGGFPCEYDIRDENHVVMTVNKCIALEYFERDDPGRIVPMCQVVEPVIMKKYLINPDIQVTPLKLPPRKSQDEVACRWEFKLEKKAWTARTS